MTVITIVLLLNDPVLLLPSAAHNCEAGAEASSQTQVVAAGPVKAGNDPPPISFRGQKSTIDRIYWGRHKQPATVKLIIFVRFKQSF